MVVPATRRQPVPEQGITIMAVVFRRRYPQRAGTDNFAVYGYPPATAVPFGTGERLERDCFEAATCEKRRGSANGQDGRTGARALIFRRKRRQCAPKKVRP